VRRQKIEERDVQIQQSGMDVFGPVLTVIGAGTGAAIASDLRFFNAVVLIPQVNKEINERIM
jgi:hypothetical protein